MANAKLIVDREDNHAIAPNDPADDAPPRFGNMDGFANEITGVGDWLRDKTFGGKPTGPDFVVRFLTGVECEDRWRGSDLGARIIETVPNEMVREGWELQIQPTEKGDERVDAFPVAAPFPPPAPKPLPEADDDSQVILEAIEAKERELSLRQVIREALCYERAFGGAAILVGVDDGEQDLTRPLDDKRIRSVNHLTAFRGGWDGELIAWRYYNDPRQSNFGRPEIYMLRNLGVPIAAPPAPGETKPPTVTMPAGPAGAMQFYVHESRLLVFPGTAVSRRARVQMRGWGDSVFTRANEVLSQYGQTWGAVAVLMQEWAQGVLKIAGLSEIMASQDPKQQGALLNRARMLQMTQSIARVRMIDKEEEFSREVAPLTGIADVLEQFDQRLAASADMPVALLTGQRSGLNATGDADTRFFYDRIAASCRDKLLPLLHRLQRLLFLAKDSPTKGKEPARWSIQMRSLWQPTEAEQAELRFKQQQTDIGYINAGVLTPEEIAASRFGGSTYSTDTVLDLEGRTEMARVQSEAPPVPSPPPAPSETPANEGDETAVPSPPQEDSRVDEMVDQLHALEQKLDQQRPEMNKAEELEITARALKTMREAGAVVDVERLREQFPDLPVKHVIED